MLWRWTWRHLWEFSPVFEMDFQFLSLSISWLENILNGTGKCFDLFFFTPTPLKEVKEVDQERLEAGKKGNLWNKRKLKQIVASGISIPHPQLVLIKETPMEELSFLLWIPGSGPASWHGRALTSVSETVSHVFPLYFHSSVCPLPPCNYPLPHENPNKIYWYL